MEGVVGIAAGIAAGSIALVGFGVDSYVEVFAGSVIVWRLARDRKGEELSEKAEECDGRRRFGHAGLDVLTTDPAPSMVAYCRSLGVEAMQADVLGLTLDEPRGAALAMNSLLHVPRVLFQPALARVAATCGRRASYIGVCGGRAREGILDYDGYAPKRWFASHTTRKCWMPPLSL